MAATRKARKRTTKRAPARKKSSSSSSRRGGGNKAVDRASASLDASQKAFRDLRDELQRGGSKLIRDADLRDLEKTVKSAGTSFRRLSRRLLKDLEDVQKAATTGRKPAKRKSSTKRTTGTKRKASSSAKRGATKTKRAASSARTTAKKAAKRTSGAAKGAKTGAKRGAGGAKKRSGAKKRR